MTGAASICIKSHTNTDTNTNTEQIQIRSQISLQIQMQIQRRKGDSIVTGAASICIKAHTNIWLPSFQREGQASYPVRDDFHESKEAHCPVPGHIHHIREIFKNENK